MSEYRLIRLGRQIQEEIGALIVEGKIKDYRINPFFSINRVEVSRDLSFADVYVTCFQETTTLERGVTGFQSAAGFIQSILAKKMHIRQTPKLRFHADFSIHEGFDLVKRIEELNA